MRASFDINYKAFDSRCASSINKVGNGSRKALLEACETISNESLAQVPRDTETLANSHFYEVTGDYRTGWDAVIGYGRPNYVNPVSGVAVSEYMIAVHEDVMAKHVIGKAKFLEDPVREYARENFPRTVFKYVQEGLSQ